MRRALKASTIERISAAQFAAPASTPERRLEILKDLISRKDVGSDDMRARWQAEVNSIELMIESEKVMGIVVANTEKFRQMREEIAFACLIAEDKTLNEFSPAFADESDWMREPTDAQLLAIQQENEIASYDFLNECAYDETCKQCIHPVCRNYRDPRTPAQRDLDDWQAQASATRKSDHPY